MNDFELRPELPEDDDFLFALFAEETVPMLHAAGVAEEQARHLARIQHRARAAAFRAGLPAARFSIATCGAAPVGRRVDRREADRLHLVDLAVARAWRRRGFAAALLDGLIGEAGEAGLPVTLNVEAANAPALGLYRKRGFAVVAQTPPYLLMRLDGTRRS